MNDPKDEAAEDDAALDEDDVTDVPDVKTDEPEE